MGEGPPPTLGITTRSEGGRAVVAATLTGSPAEAAGLYAGDEIVAFCGFKVTEATLADRLGARRPGDRVSLVVFRRDELREVEVTLGAANKDKFEIVPRAGASDEERAACRAWIGDDLAGEKPGQAG
jgi:predicted metalloprotease with PDZ domain